MICQWSFEDGSRNNGLKGARRSHNIIIASHISHVWDPLALQKYWNLPIWHGSIMLNHVHRSPREFWLRWGDVIAFVNQSMQQQTIQSAGNAGSAGKDFNYPVEVADGRRLTISWNRGENPEAEPDGSWVVSLDFGGESCQDFTRSKRSLTSHHQIIYSKSILQLNVWSFNVRGIPSPKIPQIWRMSPARLLKRLQFCR